MLNSTLLLIAAGFTGYVIGIFVNLWGWVLWKIWTGLKRSRLFSTTHSAHNNPHPQQSRTFHPRKSTLVWGGDSYDMAWLLMACGFVSSEDAAWDLIKQPEFVVHWDDVNGSGKTKYISGASLRMIQPDTMMQPHNNFTVWFDHNVGYVFEVQEQQRPSKGGYLIEIHCTPCFS